MKSLENISSFDFLSTLSEFLTVTPEDIKTLAECSRLETLEAGKYILSEGEASKASGFIVVSGRLAMLKTSTNGKELIVELLQAKDTFGLLTTLTAERLPIQLSAKALQTSKVLWIPIYMFINVLTKYPDLFKEFMAHALVCLHSSYSLSRGLAHDRVEVRIASILASLALKFARPLADKKFFTVHFTRQQLADLTGTTPETAIRVTRQMQKDGLIDISRPGIIKILNLSAIQKLADV